MHREAVTDSLNRYSEKTGLIQGPVKSVAAASQMLAPLRKFYLVSLAIIARLCVVGRVLDRFAGALYVFADAFNGIAARDSCNSDRGSSQRNKLLHIRHVIGP